MKYEAVIGLEVHAQMLTETKIFCGCSTRFGAEPNTQTCPVCAGMPGVLPVLNKKALEFAVKTGFAMNCSIAPYSRFARKNYFYPDLPKGYQISQYELPICEHGWVDIAVDGQQKRIGITRIHMEDDAGKNIHDPEGGFSLVDLNRTGMPLMEIVSEPDMRNPQEASAYMKKIRTIVRSLGVCDGNMEQGSLRCDANVSVRREGTEAFGTKVELKNMNSFRFVERALEYEIKRQIKTLEEGGSIVQETRLWDTTVGITNAMRTKEEAHDYRYFPDPDLVPMVVDQTWIEGIRAGMPELPEAKMKRFIEEYGLPEHDAGFLTSEGALADWFEEAVKAGGQPKPVSNWMMGSIMKHLSADNITIEEYPISPGFLVAIIQLIEKGKLNNNSAKKYFDETYEKAKRGDVTAILDGNVPSITAKIEASVEEKGLVQITDEGAIQEAVDEVIKNNPKEFERLCAGEDKLMGFFVGQVMKLTKGKANPKLANDTVSKRVKEA